MTRYIRSCQIGDAAEFFACAKITAVFGHACRLNTGVDTGLDGHVELVVGDRASGSILGLQVKGTEGPVDVSSGTVSTYIDEAHLSYWRDHDWPVIYAFVDLSSGKVWLRLVRRLVDFSKTSSGYRVDFRAEQDELNNISPDLLIKLALPSGKDDALHEYNRLTIEVARLRHDNVGAQSTMEQIGRARRVNEVRQAITMLENTCNLSPRRYSTLFRNQIRNLRDEFRDILIDEEIALRDGM